MLQRRPNREHFGMMSRLGSAGSPVTYYPIMAAQAYRAFVVSVARSLMTTSLAPILPSDETAWLSVPAASATLLAIFSEVLAAPSATACVHVIEHSSHLTVVRHARVTPAALLPGFGRSCLHMRLA